MASLCKNLHLGANCINHRLWLRPLCSSSISTVRPRLDANPQTTGRLAHRPIHYIALTSPATADAIQMIRDTAPAHYLVRLDSFSLLDKYGTGKYETGEFKAGGYNWKLIIYPNGQGKTGTDGSNVCVNLAMADPHTLPANWEVSASFSICVFNHIFGNYHYALGRTHRFHAMKTEWGFSNFISKKDLTNPSNGFLIDGDSCVFGAEVLANENEAVNEYVCLTNVNVPYKQEIKISNFSSLKGGWFSDNVWTSDEFTASDRKWSISVFLNGDGEATGRSLSIFLNHDASNERVKATYYLCLKSQVSDEHNVRKHGSCWFTHSGSNSWGWLSFMDHASLNDPTKGYIVNDCVHLEIELSVEAVATI